MIPPFRFFYFAGAEFSPGMLKRTKKPSPFKGEGGTAEGRDG